METRYVEIYVTAYALSEQDTPIHKRILNEILQLAIDKLTITILDDQSEFDRIFSQEKSKISCIIRKPDILKFTYPFVIDKNKIQNKNDLIAETINFYLARMNHVNIVCSVICDIFTSANILMPGITSAGTMYIHYDYEENAYMPTSLFNISNTLKSYAGMLQKINPEIFNHNRKLVEVYKWLSSIPKSEIYLSKNKIGRTIGALNQLLYSEIDGLSAMIWIMTGLESIFCEGKAAGKGSQIKGKAQALFPSIIINKQLEKMYTYRSDFLHGNKDLLLYPSRVVPCINPNGETWPHTKELEENFYTALHLLLKTLQYLQENNLYELEFEYLPKVRIE